MIFGTNNILKNFENISLTYAKDLIDRIDSGKYLGVLFDPLLTWCNHVNSISSRISERIGLIRRFKFFLPISTLNKLANALVVPHFDYCSSVWSNCNVQFVNSLQILQNRLARVLVSADIRTRIIDLMNTLLMLSCKSFLWVLDSKHLLLPCYSRSARHNHTSRDGHQNLKLLWIDLTQMHLIGLVERNILVFKSSKSDVPLQSYG